MRFERIVGGEGPPRIVGVRKVPLGPRRTARPEAQTPERENDVAARRARTDHGQEAPAARPEGHHVRPASYVAVSALLSALVFGIFLVSDRGLLQARKQRVQLAKAREEVEQLEAENKRLDAEVAALRNDPHALEKVAREQLNLVRPGEVVLVLPQGWEKRVKPAAAPAPAPTPR